MNAKKIHDNPTADELRAFTEEMPACRVTEFDNVNVQTRVTSRTGSTYIVTEDPAATGQKAMTREEFERIAKMQDEYIARAGDGRRSTATSATSRASARGRDFHRARQRERRRHAAEAVLRRATARSPRSRSSTRRTSPRRATRTSAASPSTSSTGSPASSAPTTSASRRRAACGCGTRSSTTAAAWRCTPGCKSIPVNGEREGVPDHRPVRHRQDHHDVHHAERLAPGAGRLRRAHARRQGVRHRERLLRQDVLAGPRLRAEHLQRRRQAHRRTSRTSTRTRPAT